MATIFELEEAQDSAVADIFNAQQAGDYAAAAAAQATLDQLTAYMSAFNAGGNIGGVTLPSTSTSTTIPTSAPPAGSSAPPSTGTTPGGSSSGAKPRNSYGPDPGTYCDEFPDDPICQIFYGGSVAPPSGPIEVITGGGSDTVNITVNGLTNTQVDGIIDNALGDLWNATVGAVDAVIAAAVGAIQKTITDLGNALKAAYAQLSRLAGFILNLLKQLVDEVVKGILGVLHDIRTLLGDLYKDVLVPIANGVIKIRQALLDVYKRFIRPMLLVLQDIRKVLSILSIFHVKFAAKLDTAIADIERRITQPLFYLLSYVNAVSNWINLIVAANYLLQKPLFLNSLKGYLGESINLQVNGMTKPTSADDLAAAQQAAAFPSAQQSQDDLLQFMSTRSGAMADVIAQQLASLQQQTNAGL